MIQTIIDWINGVVAPLLQNLKVKNPTVFLVVQSILTVAYIVLWNVDIAGQSEWLQFVIAIVMGVVSSQTFEFLPKEQQEKQIAGK